MNRSRLQPPRGLAGRLWWLLYLAIYPLPWLDAPPGWRGVLASLGGTALFLALFLRLVLARGRRPVAPTILGAAAIGFALSPFGGAWSVFNIYAASFAALLASRRAAVLTIGALVIALVAFGLGTGAATIAWLSGVGFSIMAAGGTLLQADLERRNRLLFEAQAEIRVLAASSERERIARDLHDLLGHTLTLVAVKADLASRLLARNDGAAARREVDDVAAAARNALAEVRLAVTGMRGASLAAEAARARAALVAAGIEPTIRVGAAPPGADPTREAVLAMALREAVTNVVRHAAGARSCTVAVAAEPNGGLLLSIADDGAGGATGEGAGLAGMRTRLAAVGGALQVESDGTGTRVTARLPPASPASPAGGA